VPAPELEEVPIAELLARVERLLTAGSGTGLAVSVRPPGLCLWADQQLVEQMVINLVGNAREATAGRDDAEIQVEAHVDDHGRPRISVTDNGSGIVGDALDKVFVPFYSTKEGGEGIGLSLSLQIMRLHRGDLTVRSEPGVRTTFTMRFPPLLRLTAPRDTVCSADRGRHHPCRYP
jgi:signal transduction histidine kinase